MERAIFDIEYLAREGEELCRRIIAGSFLLVSVRTLEDGRKGDPNDGIWLQLKGPHATGLFYLRTSIDSKPL